MSVNDSTIVLNLGVGGDVTDATEVTDPTGAIVGPIKRERVVIGGDQDRAAVLDLLLRDGSYKLPVHDQLIRRQLEQLGVTLLDLGKVVTSLADDVARGVRKAQAEEPSTFSVVAPGVATAGAKSMISLVNGIESQSIVRLLRAYLVNVQTVGTTGVVATFEMRKIANHSAGTLLIPAAYDIDDLSPTVRTGATVTGEMDLFWRWIWSTDEWGPGPSDTESADHALQTLTPSWEQSRGGQPIIIRPGSGIHISCVTVTTTGLFDLILVFSQVPV